MLYFGLRLIHILFMAAWIGAAIFAPRDIKRSFAAGQPHIDTLVDRMKFNGAVAMIGGFGTLISGFILILVRGGFGSLPTVMHVGVATGILTSIVGGAGIGRTWGQIEQQLKSGADPTSLAPLVGRISQLSSAFRGLWLVTLVLMVFRGAFG